MIARIVTLLHRRFICLAACTLALSAVVPAQPALAETVGDGELVVPLHRSELISLPADLAEVIVADPDTADIYVHGSNKVSVVGKRVGSTSVRILDGNNRVMRSYVVRVTYDIPAIRQVLYELFPYEDISVQVVNNTLALVGTVSSTSVADKAVRVANEYLIPREGETPRPRTGDFVNADQTTGDKGVLNMLKITSGQQVMLRVRVGEIQRDVMKELGFNWSVLNDGLMSIATSGAITEPYLNLTRTHTFGDTQVTGIIDALERNSIFKVMAEPNLVAMSGEEAEFLSGGEFPVLVATNDNIQVEYKQYGVAVRFLPQVLSESRIRLVVKPEISELTDVGSVQLNGITIPALNTRRAKTTVELAPGESFMIAGLLKDQMNSNIDQAPGLGEVPVLGGLFRASNFQRNETELVIAVTPYLVDPVAGEDVRLPTDEFRPPSMMEQFFYGALGSLSGNALRTSQTPVLEGPIGFMVD